MSALTLSAVGFAVDSRRLLNCRLIWMLIHRLLVRRLLVRLSGVDAAGCYAVHGLKEGVEVKNWDE